jgi:hypothetical protein
VQIIPKVLQKLRAERVRAVVVMPEWCGKAWWNLLQIGVERETDLGKSSDVLIPGPVMATNLAKLLSCRLLMAVVSLS